QKKRKAGGSAENPISEQDVPKESFVCSKSSAFVKVPPSSPSAQALERLNDRKKPRKSLSLSARSETVLDVRSLIHRPTDQLSIYTPPIHNTT
ncbi:hypothetical protein BGX27_006745, partial [Mortierella sp. AM989]